MDLEAALGLLLMGTAGCYLLYLVFQAIFQEPKQTLSDFRKSPVRSILGGLGVVGVLIFVVSVMSMGYLTFDVPTPWGRIKSQWLGGLLALLSIPAFLFRGKRK